MLALSVKSNGKSALSDDPEPQVSGKLIRITTVPYGEQAHQLCALNSVIPHSVPEALSKQWGTGFPIWFASYAQIDRERFVRL